MTTALPVYQDSCCTEINRYPEIFERAAALVPSGNVLSFGCSTGEEVRSLKALNNAWEVHGVETNLKSLMTARQSDPEGIYVSCVEELPLNAYDLVFCMSVLCRFPPVEDQGPYFLFSDFEKAVSAIDSVVSLNGGLLILWNAQYDFRQTSTALNYEPCSLQLRRGISGFAPDECLLQKKTPGSGFVPKYSRDGILMTEEQSDDVPLAFRKLLPAEVSVWQIRPE